MLYSRRQIPLFVLMVLIAMISSAPAQSNVWPVWLSLPDVLDKDTTHKKTYQFDNSLVISDIVKSKNILSYTEESDSSFINQRLGYNVANYLNDVQSHYVDLSGKYLRHNVFNTSATLGVDWTPGLYYYKSKNSGILQVPVDLGPVVDFGVYEIPLEIRGGVSAYGWNDKFNRESGLLQKHNYEADPGYYGGCSIGDSVYRWFGLPLVVNADILGKSIGGTALGVIKSSLKTAWGIASEDSIFFMAGDSLSNGKELYGAGSNSTLYSTTPWKVEHNLMLTAAVRGKERFKLRPAVLYSYKLKNIRYPSQPGLLDDVRINRNSIGFQAATGDDARIQYNGGISFAWDNTDWIYNEDEQSISSDLTLKKQAVNLGDYDEYIAQTDHDVLLKMPAGFALNYQLHCARNSKSYPYEYTNNGTVITNDNENDRVNILNHGGVLYENDSLLTLELYGEKSKNYLYYYRKARSGESRTTDNYKIGCNASIILGRVRIGETIFGTAEKSDYRFKNVHKGEFFDPPPYSRKFSSLMIISWLVNEQWTVTGKWNETYYDNGKWYGKAYSDSIYQIDKEYYAIENYSIDYYLQLLLGYARGPLMLEGGIAFSDNYFMYYKNGSYEKDDMGRGYIWEPSLEFHYFAEKITVGSKLQRKFNSLDKDIYDPGKNWNFGVTLNVAF